MAVTTTSEFLFGGAWALLVAAVLLVAVGGVGYWVRGLVEYRRREEWKMARQRSIERHAEDDEIRLEFAEPPTIPKTVILQNQFTRPREVLFNLQDHGSQKSCAGCFQPFTAGQAILQHSHGLLCTQVCIDCGDSLPVTQKATA